MKNIFSLKNILIILAVVMLCAIIFYLSLKKSEYNPESKIENWNLYQEISNREDKWIGAGDCSSVPPSSNEFNHFKDLIGSDSMKKLVLSGNFELVITPNFLSWTNEKFLNFNHDDSAICAAGGRYPLKAYSDKLLWSGVCGSGIMPESGTPAYKDFIQCQKSENVVRDYFQSR